MKAIDILGKKIGKEHPPFIIAELSGMDPGAYKALLAAAVVYRMSQEAVLPPGESGAKRARPVH